MTKARALCFVPFVFAALSDVDATRAWAQTAPAASASAPPPLSASLTGDAKVDYDAGKNLFEIRDYRGAFLKFQHAFELSKDSRLLWNMAVCEKELHHYARAVTLVERYLKEAGAKLSPETRANAMATAEALRGLYSTATLDGAPAGAKVFVDDEEVGTTPLAGPINLDLGSHRVRLEHPEFEALEQSVNDVVGGKPITIGIAMKPLTGGRLSVIAGPGDTIMLDGRVVGTERWEGNVAAGTHDIRVSAVGKKTEEMSVDIATRGTKTVQVSLKEEKKGPLWPWLVGGAALVTGAVVGGYFLFRPEDKPGPYTSGGLGTVILPGGFR